MKFLFELLTGVIAGVVAAIILNVMNVEITVTQTGFLVGGTIAVVIMLQEIFSAILKKREEK